MVILNYGLKFGILGISLLCKFMQITRFFQKKPAILVYLWSQEEALAYVFFPHWPVNEVFDYLNTIVYFVIMLVAFRYTT